MPDREQMIRGLDEISQYFYGCYRNAGGGTRACEKFHDWMCAVDEVKNALTLLKAQETVVRCKDCKHCEYPDAEREWCKMGHLHGNAETWFCADGEREEK